MAYPWLQVDEDGPRDVSCVVALVKEDILAVAAFSRKLLEIAVLVDPMLLAKLLPEFTANFMPSAMLASLGSGVCWTRCAMRNAMPNAIGESN
jgi:F0F1-type ATP synthase gamma subunit